VNWEEEARTLLALFRMESEQLFDDPSINPSTKK
jgi:hypothetical protein